MSEDECGERLQRLIEAICHIPGFETLTVENPVNKARNGDTLFHVAAVFGDSQIMGTLSRAGIDINEKSEHGYTALHEAALRGDKRCYARLVELGADEQVENDLGETPANLLDLFKDETAK